MKLSYDFHTHILPGVDDGASDTDQALSLISALKENGVKKVCLTPHFYTHKESFEDFVSRRDAAARDFIPRIQDEVEVKLGAEVFVTPYLFSESRDFSPLCMTGTNYMLTEFPYTAGFSGETMKLLLNIRNIGVTPILAHIERYPKLMKEPQLVEELIYMGVIIQSNAVSFTDKKLRFKLMRYLKKGYIQIISSDVHSLRRNPPSSYKEVLEIFKKKCPEVLPFLESNAEEIWNS